MLFIIPQLCLFINSDCSEGIGTYARTHLTDDRIKMMLVCVRRFIESTELLFEFKQ